MLGDALKKYKIFAAIKPKSEPYRDRLVEATAMKQTRRTVELEYSPHQQTHKKKGKGDAPNFSSDIKKNSPSGGAEVTVVAIDF